MKHINKVHVLMEQHCYNTSYGCTMLLLTRSVSSLQFCCEQTLNIYDFTDVRRLILKTKQIINVSYVIVAF